MTISIIDAINSDETRNIFLVSQIVGRHFIDTELGSRGLTAEQIQQFVNDIGDWTAKQLPDLNQSDVTITAERLAEALDVLNGSDAADWPEAVREAQNFLSNERHLAAADNKASAGKLIALAVAAFILSQQLSVRHETETEDGRPKKDTTSIEYSVGFPAASAKIVEEIAKRLNLLPKTPSKLSIKTPADKVKEPNPDSGKQTSEAPTRDSRAADVNAMAEVDPELLDAIAALGRIEEAWSTGAFIKALGGSTRARSLFQQVVPRECRPFVDAFSEVPFALGFSIVKSRSGTDGDRINYRPAVRIQSPWKPLKSGLQQISGLTDKLSGANVHTRWTAPIVLLGSNPDGNMPPWTSRPLSPPIGGNPVAVAGGSPGSVGLFLHDGQKHFMLTAGHVAEDDQPAGVIGRAFFSPLQPEAPHYGASPLGHVDTCTVFPPGSLVKGIKLEVNFADYCLIEMSPGFLPLPDKRLRMGNRQFSPNIWAGELVIGLSVVKGTACSAESVGRIISDLGRYQMMNRTLGIHVNAGPVIEIALDRDSPPASLGDSGALVCVEAKGRLQPLGIVVATALTSHIDGLHSAPTSLIYVQPLSNILSAGGEPNELRIV